MSEIIPNIPMPKRGIDGIEALIELGPDRLRGLARLMAAKPLQLSFDRLLGDLSDELRCELTILQRAFSQALIPMNGMRRTLKVTPEALVAGINQAILRQQSNWKEKHLKGWEAIAPVVLDFFVPDNFFSQASKAFELLSQRPAILQGAKVLTELRPIYSEDTSRTLAQVQTNTLVLTYWKGEDEGVLHVTLDSSDLESLLAEIDNAKRKIAVTLKEAAQAGVNVLAYGSAED